MELAPEVVTSLNQMRDRGELPPRHDGVIRSAIAGVVRRPIFNCATPYSTYLRGVIIDGGILLTGRDDSALITEG